MLMAVAVAAGGATSCGEDGATTSTTASIDPARVAKRDAIRNATDAASYSPTVRDCLADRAVASPNIDIATLDQLTDAKTTTNDISEANRSGFLDVVDKCLDIKVMAALTVVGVVNEMVAGLHLPDGELACARDKLVELFPTASALMSALQDADEAMSAATTVSIMHALGACMSEASMQSMVGGIFAQQGLTAAQGACVARGVIGELGVQRLADTLGRGTEPSPGHEEFVKASERAGRNCG